jgi:hypothetical protein
MNSYDYIVETLNMTDKYGNLYANDTICKRFLKLGFSFAECQWQSHYDSRMLFEDNDKTYYRPLLTTINDWLAFGNLEERTKRDEKVEGMILTLIKEGLI